MLKLSDDRVEQVIRFELDSPPADIDFLAEIGKRLIENDKTALVEYAVRKIVEDQIQELEGMDRDGIIKRIKEGKKT